MSSAPACPLIPRHPDEFHATPWDAHANRPVVDGKYQDPVTGELRTACGSIRGGPPSVDIVIMNINVSSCNYIARASRDLPTRTLLCHIMKVVEQHMLGIDSVNATEYSIRLVLCHQFENLDQWREISGAIVDGFREPGYRQRLDRLSESGSS